MESSLLIEKYIENVKKKPEEIKKLGNEILIEHPEICVELIKEVQNGLQYIPLDVREKLPQVCVEAVEINPENI